MTPKVTEAHKADVENQILQAAFECFCKRGYDRTRMDDVAEKSNVSKGTLYLYFKNKEDLFNSISLSQVERLKSELTQVFAGEGDLADKASVLHDRLREADAGSEAVAFEMLAESTRNPRLRKILQTQRKEVHRVVAEFLKSLAGRGMLPRDSDFEALAAGYVALYGGLGVNVVLGFPDSLIRRAWSQTTKAIIDGTTKKLSLNAR